MTASRDASRLATSQLAQQLIDLLSKDKGVRSPEIDGAVRALIEGYNDLGVIDLWAQDETAATYWVLMLSGINQPDEVSIAGALLTWQTFSAKHSARVLCVQSSERQEFRVCSSAFGVVDCPSLIFSDNPSMDSFIRIDGPLLFTLMEHPGGLQRFLTGVHAMVEHGQSLRDIEQRLLSEKFWRGMRLIFKEIKGLLSITVGTGGSS